MLHATITVRVKLHSNRSRLIGSRVGKPVLFLLLFVVRMGRGVIDGVSSSEAIDEIPKRQGQGRVECHRNDSPGTANMQRIARRVSCLRFRARSSRRITAVAFAVRLGVSVCVCACANSLVLLSLCQIPSMYGLFIGRQQKKTLTK